MPVTIKSRIVADVVILDIAGRFAIGETSLRDSVKTFLADGRRHFLLNLPGVPYLGSWSIAQFISALTAIRSRNGTMGLLALVKAARDVLNYTKLDTVFPIYTNEVEALQNLGTAPIG